jgi:hypothetical protein
MPNDSIDAKGTDRKNKTSQPRRADATSGQRSPGKTPLDSADIQPGEGQPEIPKVGSRDAPGG